MSNHTKIQHPASSLPTEEDREGTDALFMRRCLQLARCGRQNAKPNPMVGAVIVAADGRILGEGYHVRCGSAHAEVNAFDSVRPEDEPLLKESTLYVSLEPCSHFGRTPPCADLIVRKGVRRVVVGCVDPFAKVRGRGIEKLRDAGIDVTVGVLEEECRALNSRFMTFNEHHRPYITLKWAQSADARIDDHHRPVRLSSDFTTMLVHKLRSEHDAILVGRVTEERDRPRLDVRHWTGISPRRLVIDRSHPCFEGLDFSRPVIPQLLDWLCREGCQSLLVEGGAATLQSFIDAGAWDEIRRETAPILIGDGTQAPVLPPYCRLVSVSDFDNRRIEVFRKAEA